MRHITIALATSLFFVISLARPGVAQETPDSWIQLSAHRILSEAEEIARRRAADLGAVAGFSISGGWYVVALGPFLEADARAALRQLRAEGRIPRDSFIVRADVFGQQFYPVGADARERPALAAAPENPAPTATATDVSAEAPAAPLAAAQTPEPQDETPAEARRSEARLGRDERAELQRALQWFGHYEGRIDASFGPATRRAMAAWQVARGHEPTGILTTRQRAELLDEYRGELAAIGLELVRDETAGIEIELPMGMVRFDRYDPPFAHYPERDGSGVSVLLISQAGDEGTLLGLYDIMQTLEIVPLEGARSRRGREFLLTGANERITSHTYARVADGAVKGFTLIWPAGEDRRREFVLERMRESFRPIRGASLPDTLGEGALEQSVDLLAGLKIRRPEKGRSGFFVDPRGAVLTVLEAVEGCGRVTLEETHVVDVTATDPTLGVALLEPREALAPRGHARFRLDPPRLQSEVAVAGYSFEGILSAPTLTFGKLADMRGLRGEEALDRLALPAAEGDAGGPVFDLAGAVAGMLLPRGQEGARLLPGDVSFAVDAPALAQFLRAAGKSPARAENSDSLAPEELAEIAADVTVLVSCWKG
ncbi:Trypsin-like peptidase domain-containing protein [Meinhardsimonia xiamenensis]|jgi:peptidoglycan hydrolase-like protein with peptidoglycan-binding domain|uniref:Trypsin-like peptidase domain-containing protein n=1 Tax=Meinhardsimonia xiamenensis TaxID=990712 RepID=A0A1G9D0W4_9RHOB|nr:peptidoglycan-binding protein [Meinhardsimonia xiamenensis]PRX38178.1 trypsin-like peptidase [Meinhardsimonia xiamenensis]SDK57305.1 Trypsin-like peptidase domain-containing protein [Meinhardsimonia xiamenensis]